MNAKDGMRTFWVIWGGQAVSMIGTAMTRFALLIWAFERDGSATTLALLGFFSFCLYLLFSPLAGVLVDRWDRRKVMLWSDLGAGVMTAGLLGLCLGGHLQLWHVYLAQAVSGACEAFQGPAYTASVTLLVPKAQYARANGLVSLALSAARLLSPALAGAVLSVVQIEGVMTIDVLTFLVSMGTLLFVRVPRPVSSAVGRAAGGQLWAEMSLGLRFIRQCPGLLGMVFIFSGINLFASLTYFSILPAYILARSSGDKMALGVVQSVMGIGEVLGGVLVGVSGGPRRKVHGFLLCTALSFLCGDLVFAAGRSLPAWVAAALGATIFIPFIVSSSAAIWQAKVPPDVQGRVFASKDMLQQTVMPLGYLGGGLLADHVFNPAMSAGGAWSALFSGLVGSGPGAGIGLMFVCTGLLGAGIGLGGYLLRPVREIERDLPDYDVAAPETRPVADGLAPSS